MRKNLRRAASLLVSLSLCASAFAGLTAHGYEAKISGWSNSISDSYSWLQKDNVTEADMNATYEAAADELKYQNETLGFKIGTKNDGSTSYDLNDGWNQILHIQFENWVKPEDDITDNIGNPWGQTNPDEGTIRKWGMLNVPFIGMAFTCKGQMSAASPDCGQPILSNEFTVGDTTYQQMWGNIRVLQNGSVSITNMYPGIGDENKDITNNTFRYAVAEYNQRNKRAGSDGKGLFAGYASQKAAFTADGKIIYQELTGPSGKAYLAVDAGIVDTAKLTGAQVIPSDLVPAFDGLGDNMDARFAVTGAPVSAYANGEMTFANGILTADGFKSTAAAITGFSFDEDAAPAIIDNENHTITAFVKDSANVASLTPAVTISGSSYSPSGAQNFTNPVTYTVTAAAGNTQDYTVKVIKLNDAAISTFKIEDAEGVIDQENKTITVVVYSDVDLKSVTPEVTFVGEGAAMQPASDIDLSKSWTSPVEVTVTCGGASAKYTIKARNMSADNSITSFSVPKDKMKYAESDVVATIDNVAKTISMVYPWGNFQNTNKTVPYGKVPVNVTLPEGATISPDPTIARDQLGQQYIVTSEDGTQAVYTVQITLSDDHTFPAVESMKLTEQNNWNRFDAPAAKEALFAAILEEYNYQRTELGFDPGELSGTLQGWGDLLSRQFFANGSGSVDCGGEGTAMIAADVCYGKAYTLKDTMWNAWTNWNCKDEDGVDRPGHDKSGCPTENEFKMGDLYYQQFSMSYGTYNATGGTARVANGVGTSYNTINAALKAANSPFYDLNSNQINTNIRNTFRDAYEGANISGVNPGIALDGSLKFDAEHHILYQVFSGTGAFHSTERDASNKTILIKGLTPAENEDGEIELTANGSAMALLPRIQYVYENIDLSGSEAYGGQANEYVDVSLDGFNFKYSETLGMPNSAPQIAEDGSVTMQFAKGFAYCAKDSDEVVWTDGSSKSHENRMESMKVTANVAVDSYAYYHLTDENKEDEEAQKIKDAVRIHFASGADVDLTNIVIDEVIPLDAETATVQYDGKAFEPGTAVNLTYSAIITVAAESGDKRSYRLYAWQDGKPLSQDDPAYGTPDSSEPSVPSGTVEPSNPSDINNGENNNGGNTGGEVEYEYGYYDENGVWHEVTKAFYDRWVGQSGGNAQTGDAGVVGVVLLTAAAAGALVVLRKKK